MCTELHSFEINKFKANLNSNLVVIIYERVLDALNPTSTPSDGPPLHIKTDGCTEGRTYARTDARTNVI